MPPRGHSGWSRPPRDRLPTALFGVDRATMRAEAVPRDSHHKENQMNNNHQDEEETTPTSVTLEVGRRLRSLRKARHMSLDDVERQSQGRWSASAIGAYERGFRTLSLPRLHELAEFYDVSVSVLLGEQTPSAEGPAEARPRPRSARQGPRGGIRPAVRPLDHRGARRLQRPGADDSPRRPAGDLRTAADRRGRRGQQAPGLGGSRREPVDPVLTSAHRDPSS